MDKNAIRKYAVWARRELIEKVTQKAQQFGVEDGKEMDINADSVNGVLLTDVQKKQRQALIQKVKQDGFQQVMEEVAYTWFNRFIALRFMEVNGYLPSHVRVFTDDNNAFKPQILSEALHLDLAGLDMDKVYAMKEANQDEELFKYLLIVQCNDLKSILPGMFQKIADYTELLLPDYLLRDGSVIEQMIIQIPEGDWDITQGGQVEIIGWMYQYYISEKHEEVVDPLHGKIVKKEEVPAATQLFTTDWVVRYLVDNSVGRYWIERNPQSKLADELPYFVKPRDGIIPTVAEKVTPQEITVLDPCIGSGHFAVYAFDVLMKIYEEYGFSEREAATEIVKNNLFGLDIDGRATQLAYFAVMMKARQYDRRFLARGIQPHIYEIGESNNIERSALDYFCGNCASLRKDVNALLTTFEDAKEYGSIIQIPAVNFENIYNRLGEIDHEGNMYAILLKDFACLVNVAEVMSLKYAVVATNPPYLNKYDVKLKKYITDNYADYKGDLFSVFMYRNFSFCIKDGYSAFMTPLVWMFIKTYEPLRTLILDEKHISTLIQFEYSAFEEATVPICAFVLNNKKAIETGYYFRLTSFKGGMEVQKQKILEAQNDKACGYYYESMQDNFSKIPGSPIAYWASENIVKAFAHGVPLSSVARTRQGLASSDNDRFLKLWWEPSIARIGFGYKNAEDAKLSGKKWFPCNKGGEFRKWYGNNVFVVNWENDGQEMLEYAAKLYGSPTRTIKNIAYYFQGGMTWGTITSAKLSMRHSLPGFIPEHAGGMIPLLDWTDKEKYLLALMNSNTAMEFLAFLSPTLRFTEGPVGLVPVLRNDTYIEQVSKIVDRCERLSISDWDSFEISWDFKQNPLVKLSKMSMSNEHGISMSNIYEKWKNECNEKFETLKMDEQEINRIFIDIYDLKGELTPLEDEKDITIHKVYDSKEEIEESMRISNYALTKLDAIKAFMSYSVGCMFGRYSLDVEGLSCAGEELDPTIYKTYMPDKDNIIPICDDEYFEDDIVGRFIKFVEVVYGKDTLEENLKFIADALGGKGTPREVIRNYFLNDFYKDHCKTYQKRPIYWLFDSGKKNGFKCLIYMHRYQPDTIARIRTDYVHEQQSRYRTAIEETEQRLLSADGSNRVKLSKKLKHLQEQDEEIHAYEEKIHHLADQMISIDLDDGVKHNYAIFQDVLAKIK